MKATDEMLRAISDAHGALSPDDWVDDLKHLQCTLDALAPFIALRGSTASPEVTSEMVKAGAKAFDDYFTEPGNAMRSAEEACYLAMRALEFPSPKSARNLLQQAAERIGQSIAADDDGRTDPLLAAIYAFLNNQPAPLLTPELIVKERMARSDKFFGAAFAQPEALAPDGFAVVLDDSSSPRGYWFAYAYIDEATAIKAAGMTKGRVVPIYFNALAAPSSEHRLSKTEEAASRPAEGIINGIPSSEDPVSLR